MDRVLLESGYSLSSKFGIEPTSSVQTLQFSQRLICHQSSAVGSSIHCLDPQTKNKQRSVNPAFYYIINTYRFELSSKKQTTQLTPIIEGIMDTHSSSIVL